MVKTTGNYFQHRTTHIIYPLGSILFLHIHDDVLVLCFPTITVMPDMGECLVKHRSP